MCRIIVNSQQDLYPAFEKEDKMAFEHSVAKSNLTMLSLSSHRSKYVSNSKLIKGGLFSSLRGKRNSVELENIREMNFQIELLRSMAEGIEQRGEVVRQRVKSQIRECRDGYRKALRTLQQG